MVDKRISRIKKELDRLWQEAVKKNAKGLCEYCGKKGESAHHFIGRANLSTRWIIENGVYLCNSCHTGSSKFSAHLTPDLFEEWVYDKCPVCYDELMQKKNQILKCNLSNLNQIKKELKSQLDENNSN